MSDATWSPTSIAVHHWLSRAKQVDTESTLASTARMIQKRGRPGLSISNLLVTSRPEATEDHGSTCTATGPLASLKLAATARTWS